MKKTINKKNLVGEKLKKGEKSEDKKKKDEDDISDNETSRYASFKSKNEKQKN